MKTIWLRDGALVDGAPKREPYQVTEDDDIILSATEVNGITTQIGIAGGNTVPISHPVASGTPIGSINVTEVLRTRMDISPNANANATAQPRSISMSIGTLNELGIVLGAAPGPGGHSFALPEGNYEIEFHTNFTMQAGTPRVNFNFLLRQGATVVDNAYGGVYMRNQNDHNQAGNTILFEVQSNGTGAPFNIATLREASDGQTSLDGGWVIIRRYEQKTVLVGS